MPGGEPQGEHMTRCAHMECGPGHTAVCSSRQVGHAAAVWDKRSGQACLAIYTGEGGTRRASSTPPAGMHACSRATCFSPSSHCCRHYAAPPALLVPLAVPPDAV
jgi:hypothetical protein